MLHVFLALSSPAFPHFQLAFIEIKSTRVGGVFRQQVRPKTAVSIFFFVRSAKKESPNVALGVDNGVELKMGAFPWTFGDGE